MVYLIRIPTARFLPGLLCGIEGLSWPVLLAAVLVEPTTLHGVVSRERPINSLAPFAKLVGTALLGVPFSRGANHKITKNNFLPFLFL